MNIINTWLPKGFPFWEQLSACDRGLLEEQSIVTSFSEGAEVFGLLKKESGIRILLEGQMRIALQNGRGLELFLYQLQTGELCVEGSLSICGKFNWDIIAGAAKDSRVLLVPEAVYLAAAKKNPSMHSFGQELVFERMAQIVSITSEYALANTQQRLAGLLLRYRQMAAGDEIKVTHEAMARDIGTAREVVSRILKQLERQGLIRMGRGRILIANAAGLQEIKYA